MVTPWGFNTREKGRAGNKGGRSEGREIIKVMGMHCTRALTTNLGILSSGFTVEPECLLRGFNHLVME